MRTGRRMVFVEAHQPLECREVEVPDPGPGEVLVRTTIAGVCGTDAHRLDGDVPSMGHPVAFGHEGIGVIERLGDGITRDWGGTPVAVGDLVYWSPGEASCPHGPLDHPWPPPATVPSQAAYQDYATLSTAEIFYRIPEGTSPEAVIAFGCAMPTAIGGHTRLGPIRPGQSVLIQGCGPVGLASTLLASLSPARQIIVIGAPDNRLAAARTLGATTTIPLAGTTQKERAEAVFSLTDGVGPDVIIEAAGKKPAFDEGIPLLARDGRYLVLGLYSGHGTVEFDPFRLNNLSQRIIGSLGPTHHSENQAVVRLAQRFGEQLGFPQLITHRFPLRRTEDAIAAMRSGDAIKAIVVPDLQD